MSEASSSTRVVSTERFEALRREYRVRTATNRARVFGSSQNSTPAPGSTRAASASRDSSDAALPR